MNETAERYPQCTNGWRKWICREKMQVLEKLGVPCPGTYEMREALLLLAIFVTGRADSGPSLRWDDFREPVYPQMARIAHITGRVVLEIIVQPDGTVAVREIEGHPILVQAAKDSVRMSKVGCDGCGEAPHTFSVVYQFKLDDPPPPAPAAARVALVNRRRDRSIRCLYLWRCGKVWLQ
jgi:hypothetical protein